MVQKVTKKIRSKLRDTVTNFSDSFTNELSLLSELMVFLNLLLFRNSSDEFGFSMPAKAITQIIIHNVKSRIRSSPISTALQHNTETESPFLNIRVYWLKNIF